MSSRTNCWRIDCEVGTSGVVTGRVRSLSSRSGQTPCWPRIAEVPVQRLKSAGSFVYALMPGFLSGLHMMSEGGSLFPQKRQFLRSENGAE